MALAGRAAEDVFFGRVTTGASDDLKRVTDIAYSMIQNYGMNSRVGQLSYTKDESGFPGDKPYSDAVAEAMDEEARTMVNDAYERTVKLVQDHREDVAKVANLLLEKETITHDDIMDLIGQRPFVGDKQYQEYITMRKEMQEEMGKESEESETKEEEEEAGNDGSFTPSPGLA